MEITEYIFKWNPSKLEFLNLDKSRQDLNQIYSIRIGQRNSSIAFVNLKNKNSSTYKVISWKDGILLLSYNRQRIEFNTKNKEVKPVKL